MIQDITFRAPAIVQPSNVIRLHRQLTGRLDRREAILVGPARRLVGLADWHYCMAERLRRIDKRRGLSPESRAAMERSRVLGAEYEERAAAVERRAHHEVLEAIGEAEVIADEAVAATGALEKLITEQQSGGVS